MAVPVLKPDLIEPAELRRIVAANDALLIDTRPAEAFARGRIPGAVNLPELFTHDFRSDPAGEAQFTVLCEDWFGRVGVRAGRSVVVYEEAMTGGLGRSCRGALILRHAGHDDVRVLHGGLRGWIAEGGALTQTGGRPESTAFRATPGGTGVFVGWDGVLAALRTGGEAIVDVRDAPEWRAETSAPAGVAECPRRGRLPGALWLPWTSLLDTGPLPRFREPGVIRAICAAHGIEPGRPVLLYCYKGARASNSYIGLRRAGFPSVRIYLASWKEWSAEIDLPIDDRLIPA